MTNRMLAILILFSIAGTLTGAYLYLYVYYKGSLAITSSHPDYSIVLSNKNLPTDITVECRKSPCEIHDIPPLSYSLTATAVGFQDYSRSIDIPAQDTLQLSIVFTKQYTREATESTGTQLSNEEKKSLLQKHSPYKLIENEAGVFIVKRIDTNRISISQVDQESFIGSFPFVGNRGDIEIFPVYGSSDMIWIRVAEQYYLYHMNYRTLSTLPFKQIDYIKTHDSSQVMIITTEGLFYYSPHNNNLTQVDEKNDFMLFGGEPVFLLQQGGLSQIQKGNDIIYSGTQNITRIYSDGENISLEDNNGKRFILK